MADFTFKQISLSTSRRHSYNWRYIVRSSRAVIIRFACVAISVFGERVC